uniref:Uncharacterized protein n=1 Tax=Podoviridae sp. ct2nF21 TaxID=2826537 RepID=A0A8S5NGU7_9CAUD|nr:MAG TPA: hypothetical protein [Podoviridae sp. ct2nF21]
MARKLTAYERERNRIKRLERKLKKQGVQYVPTEIPTLRQIKAKGFTGKALRAYVNKLKKIDIEALKAEVYKPHEEDIAFSNFNDEFLSRYSFTPEEEDFFYGLENHSDEEIEQERKRREAEYQKAATDFTSSLGKSVDLNRSRRKDAISYSRSMQSFLLNMIKEIGTSEVGRRLVEASRTMNDIDVIVSAVLWGSSVAVINQATDELLQIINGSPLTFEEKVQAESMNETENGW